jgi:hypothetical protein
MINVANIQSNITKAIKVMPTTVTIKRLCYESDGMAGTKPDGYEITVAIVDSFFNTASASRSTEAATENVDDGGTYDAITGITLMCLPLDNNGKSFTILHNDYFTIKGIGINPDVLYTVLDPNLIYGIYYMCKVEVVCI